MDDFLYRAKPWAITLLLHNWPIMLYSVLVLWAALRAYVRPTRSALLFLYGLLVLAAAFEYQKHGLGVVRGTVAYLFRTNPGVMDSANLWLLEILPVATHLSGLLLVIFGLAPRGAGSQSSLATSSPDSIHDAPAHRPSESHDGSIAGPVSSLAEHRSHARVRRGDGRKPAFSHREADHSREM